ncbi:uncharacterized protein LOC144292850 isoform X7 [Canis aureus]
MGPLPPQREAAAPGLQGGPAPGAGTGVAAIAERRPGNEGGSPGLLPGHHADRPGRQPDVPQSHHVLGPLRGWRALFHVLAAYSVYDTEVGYCQGMSEIAAIVLMFLPEDAFWALAQLMTDDRHAMHGGGPDRGGLGPSQASSSQASRSSSGSRLITSASSKELSPT